MDEETESLAGDVADRNEAELENSEDPKFAHPSKGESGESSKFGGHQNGESVDGEEKV
jgi:uric acid-xanthine permease